MQLRYRPARLAQVLAHVLLLAGLFGTRVKADDRLSGYWVPAPDQPNPAVFSIGQLGKWTIITQRWSGQEATAPEMKVRYLGVAEGNHGTLTADQNLEQLPSAPKSISYRLEAGRLTLTVPDTEHAGTYELVKGTPPSQPAPPVVRQTKAPARPTVTLSQPFPWERLVGSWASEPQSGTLINLFIAPSSVRGVFRINQRWVHGSDSPSMSQAGSYAASLQGSQAVLTKDKPDFAGSPIPLVLIFNVEGENLYVTVNDGPYAGRYQLVHQARNQKNPGE
jgi:hypothetical protein